MTKCKVNIWHSTSSGSWCVTSLTDGDGWIHNHYGELAPTINFATNHYSRHGKPLEFVDGRPSDDELKAAKERYEQSTV